MRFTLIARQLILGFGKYIICVQIQIMKGTILPQIDLVLTTRFIFL